MSDDELRRQREVLEKLAVAIAQRRMCAPAIFFFESIQPLSFIAGQALAFGEPLIKALLDIPEYQVFREALEDRENIRWLIDRLEELADNPPADDPPSCDTGAP